MIDARVTKLHELAKQLYVIAETLDDSGYPCNGCGAYRRNNWEEYMLRQKVEGAVVTVSNLATAFERVSKRNELAHISGDDK